MRTLPGTRNRVVLALVGLLLLVAAAWLIAVSFRLSASGGPVDGLLVSSDSTVGAVIGPHRAWALPAGVAAAVLVTVAGLALLVGQIPTAPARSTLRVQEPDGTALAHLEPQVLERALAERAGDVQGIEDASVRISGSAAAIRVVAEVTVADGAEMGWAVEQTRQRLASDVETSLGAAPLSVDVLAGLRGTRPAGRADRVAVGSSRRGAE